MNNQMIIKSNLTYYNNNIKTYRFKGVTLELAQ